MMVTKHKAQKCTKNILKRILLAIFVVALLFPIYWIFIVSVIPSKNLLSTDLSWLIPRELTTEYYYHIIAKTNYLKYFLNSLIVSIVTTTLTLIVASLGGYSIGRIKFKGRDTLSMTILFTYIVPPVLLLIPLFQLITRFRLQNQFSGLIMSYMTFAIPFCLWMLKGFFSSLPADIEDAALIDGSSLFGAFIRIVLPLATPGLVAAALFTFMLCWNEFLFALVFIDNDALRTIPVGVVANFYTTVMAPSDWSKIMAASMLAAVPTYLLFIFLQRHLVQGLSAGAVKE